MSKPMVRNLLASGYRVHVYWIGAKVFPLFLRGDYETAVSQPFKLVEKRMV